MMNGEHIAIGRIERAQVNEDTSLNLAVLGLTSLPAEIVSLTALEWLDLSGNQLTSIPDELFNLTSLKQLYLSNNPLTSIPDGITSNPNLRIYR